MHPHLSRSARVTALAIALVLMPAAVLAQDVEARLLRPRPTSLHPPSVRAPDALGVRDVRIPEPTWTGRGIWVARPKGLWGLSRTHFSGPPAYDPGTDAWYASAEGCLVRVEPDGTLPVVFSGLQGRDVDVRAGRRLAVSREPDDTIVLHRWDGHGGVRRTVLLRGPQFFNPRFSPDGGRVLVSESRAGGGHMWLVDLDGEAIDLGQGYDPAWHPDGERIVFLRIEAPEHVVVASTLWSLALDTLHETRLVRTTGPVMARPAVSPDGRWLGFAGEDTRDVHLASFPETPAERE